ncbi:hypothetical protein JTB14_005366 [Gonioctena quinquepunctata]|nr:hypothetical protein JTB14_005366 [Gonioctena quinquepunctata]
MPLQFWHPTLIQVLLRSIQELTSIKFITGYECGVIGTNEAKAIHFTVSNMSPIEINVSQLPQVEDDKYLGVHLATLHVRTIYQLSASNWDSNRAECIGSLAEDQMYPSITNYFYAKPSLSSRGHAEFSASYSNTDILHKFQNEVLCTIVYVPYYISTSFNTLC